MMTSLYSGPIVIRDSRIKDTGYTPVLGRGYSLGTNTFQSTCLEDVIVTEPSYDLFYTFNSLEETSSTTSSKQTTTSQSSSTAATRSGSYSKKKRGGFFGSSRPGFRSKFKNSINRMYSRVGQTQTTENGNRTSHVIEVNVDLTTYYASVDEVKSKLGASAAVLLTSKDIPGFFSSCGPYYVRSIGRKAILLSFFEYTTETTERDLEFEMNIESQIKGFRSSSRSSDSNRVWSSSKTSRQNQSRNDFASNNSQKKAEQFNSKAEERNLSITTYAFGLGKRKDAEIISYDITSFKSAIKEAFISMQNARTGKVVSMEVVPWVENIQFQQLIELDKSAQEFETVLDASGNPELDSEGKEVQRLRPQMLMYEKKMLLSENAEFIIEIDRTDRNIMNMFYKAKLCRRDIDMNWKSGNNIREEYVGALLQNNRYLDKTLPLTELDQMVSKDRINELYSLHKTFMYGKSKDKKGGASSCISNILRAGIFKVSYRETESCQSVIQNMGEIQNEIIDNYCMPELADN
ncbi:MAG: hypothetical protein GY786_03850 [Proteobacteria bacterium]|nr:hypothetical protein [Pseudomonadota bacterium]